MQRAPGSFGLKLSIPTLEVREFSDEFTRWLKQRVIYEPEVMAFRWSTTRTDINLATYRVKVATLTGSVLFSDSAGDAPQSGHYRASR